jgi:hypothetical protein
MSELIVSAVAWVPRKPVWSSEVSGAKQFFFKWIVYAEVSVTEPNGEPVTKLAKSAWQVHITFSDGDAEVPTFTVSTSLGVVDAPGFYLVRCNPEEHLAVDLADAYAPIRRPTALGVAIRRSHRTKGEDRGQVVVPITSATGPVEL